MAGHIGIVAHTCSALNCDVCTMSRSVPHLGFDPVEQVVEQPLLVLHGVSEPGGPVTRVFDVRTGDAHGRLAVSAVEAQSLRPVLGAGEGAAAVFSEGQLTQRHEAMRPRLGFGLVTSRTSVAEEARTHRTFRGGRVELTPTKHIKEGYNLMEKDITKRDLN